MPDGRGGQERRRRRGVLGRPGPGRLHPLRRGRRPRRWSDDRPRRLRRRDLAARRTRRPPSDHACWAWSTRRSAARPASTPPRARTSSASFHPPAARAVRPRRCSRRCRRPDLVSGLAEVVKVGFIADPRDPRPGRVRPGAGVPAGRRAPARARRAGDPRQGRRRRRRTCASPSRAAGTRGPQLRPHVRPRRSSRSSVPWRHGEAVSVGLVYVAELARLAGRLPAADVDRHRDVLGSLGLPTSLPRRPLAGAARRRCGVDKKARGDRLRFVVLDGVGRPGTAGRSRSGRCCEAAYAEVSA